MLFEETEHRNGDSIDCPCEIMQEVRKQLGVFLDNLEQAAVLPIRDS